MYQKIGVYLSAREDLPESFTRAAREAATCVLSAMTTRVFINSEVRIYAIFWILKKSSPIV